MNILNLSDLDLLKNTEDLVRKEKGFTIKILDHLQEIQRRKAFLECGFSSLFLYCTKVLKYSGAEAHHRIYAMKLTKNNPAAKNKIAEGKLSLTNASKIGAHIEKNKIKNLEMVAELVDKLCEKTTREAEVILFDLMPVGTKRNIKIEISVTTHQKFEQYRKEFGTYTDEEIIQRLLDAALAARAEIKFKEKTQAKCEEKSEEKSEETFEETFEEKLEETLDEKMTATKNTTAKNSRYIPAIVKQMVVARADGQCESLLRETQVRCPEKRGLEFDHIKPFALGGSNDLQNIRLLCRNCNQREVFKVFGAWSFF